LAEAPLDPSGSDALLGPLARAHGRSLGASPDEIAFAENAAREALAHDVMVRAGASVDARREVAVTFESEDHTLVEGVVDLAFEEPDGSITVVDFKTDVDETPRLASYRAQVSLYARAITKATGKPTRGVLLLV
jgi:ATP-dependent helicase/nuclease subunit A